MIEQRFGRVTLQLHLPAPSALMGASHQGPWTYECSVTIPKKKARILFYLLKHFISFDYAQLNSVHRSNVFKQIQMQPPRIVTAITQLRWEAYLLAVLLTVTKTTVFSPCLKTC